MSKHRKLRRRCLLIREKKSNGAKKGTETPPMPEKNRTNRAKRLANPGDGRIITKTAKNSSFTP
jgi:hypothetical protein